MTYLRSRLVSAALVVAVVIVVLLTMVASAIFLLGDSGWAAVPLLGVVAVAAASLFLIPVAWLPAAAILLFAVVPERITPSDGVFAAVPPITFVVVIWVFRRVVLQQSDPLDRAHRLRITAPRAFAMLAAAALLVWSVVSIARSPNSVTSMSWTVAFTCSALLVMLVPSAAKEAALLREAWIRAGFVFGLYAMLELALQGSPLYGTLYNALGLESVQHWSVYRSEVSFGHPISAGAFLAPAAVLAVAAWLQFGRKRHLLFGIGSALGVVATVSRGSIAALGAGIALAVALILVISRPRSPWRFATAIAGGALAGVLVFVASPLGERSESVESARSTESRDAGTALALRAADDSGWFGTGAGTSGLIPQGSESLVIESSLLQILVSLGLPGLALFCFVVLSLTVNALRQRDIAAATALITFVVAISGFNSIEAIRSQHLLLGLLFLICLFPAARPAPPRRNMVAQFGWDSRPSPYLAPVQKSPVPR